MKHNRSYEMKRVTTVIVSICLIALGLSLVSPLRQASGTVVGGEVFLQGNYVEVGIHQAGSFGTQNNAPAGFHSKLGPSLGGPLGFVCDMQKNGWANGVPPQSGDYFLPGTPEEGWSVEWNGAGGGERNFGNYGRVGAFQVPKTSLIETSSGSTRSAVWEGTATATASEKLKITKTIHFNVNDLFFVISTVLTNTGTATLNSVEYMRNVDPDQEQPITGNFTTSNYVVPPDATNPNRRLVVGKGLNHGITLGLGTIDPRARVSTEGFSNRDPDAIYDSPVTPAPASPIVADQAIALAYRLGALDPGQSVSFDYAYILNESDLEIALGALGSISILQPSGTVSGSSVIFQATTTNVPNTAQMQFYVNGVLIGIDTTPDAGGVFEQTFDSTLYPNGTINLKVIATFMSGATVEKSSTGSVDNSGPPVSFAVPVPGQVFNGVGIPIQINVLDASHPPVRVSFFRETSSTGSISLGQDLSEPFEASFGVVGLPEGETVIIKAVAFDSLNRSTTIQVSGVTFTNRAPVASAAGPYSVNEGAAVTLSAALSSDPDSDPLTFAWDLDGDGQFDDAVGVNPSFSAAVLGGPSTRVVNVKVTDPDGLSSTSTATVTINNVAPTANADSYSVAEDTVLNINSVTGVLANDTDPGPDVLAVSLVAVPSHGTLAISPNGSFIYTPASNYSGPDSFTYKANDGTVDSNTATVSITVNGVNDSPAAIGDSYSVIGDLTLNVAAPGVLSNDTDIDTGSITALLNAGPTHGTLNLNANGSFTYTPNTGYVGSDSFTYHANDGSANSNVATVTITVTAPVCVNHPSDLVAWYPGNSNANDVMGGNNGTLLGGATFAPGQVNQAFSFDGNGDAVSIGNPLALRLQTFTIDAWVKRASSATISFTGDGEIFGYGFGGYVLGIKNNGRVFLSKNGVGEVDSGALRVTDTNFHHVVVTKGAGSVIFYVDGAATSPQSYDPGFTFTTNAAIGAEGGVFAGSFYGLIDELEIFNRALSQAEVQSLYNASSAGKCNTAPLAQNQSVNTNEDTPRNITLGATDADGNFLYYSVVSGPLHGTLSGTAPNLTYTPTANYNGPDSFTFKANDGFVDSNTASVSITVNPINDAPAASAGGPYAVGEGASVPVFATGADIDGDPLTFAWDFDGDGQFDDAVGANPSFSAAGLDGPGTRTIRVQASDGAGGSAVSSANVTVKNVNPSAAINGAPATSPEGTQINLSSTVNDAGVPDTHTLSWSVTKGAQPTGLISWWRGEGNAQDSAGANHGQNTGAVAFVPGKAGQAFSVNGSNYINVPNQVYAVTNGGTVEFWFNRAADLGGNQVMVGSYNGSRAAPTIYFHENTLQWDFGSVLGVFPLDGTNQFIVPSLNRWYHVAFTYDSNFNVKMYLDGVLVSSGQQSAPLTDADLLDSFRIGAFQGPAGNFSGLLDEVKIYNRALSAAEVVAASGSSVVATGSGASFSFTPDDNGTYVVTFTATDDDGGVGADSKTIEVTNVNPSVDAGPNQTVDEGALFAGTGSYYDPGSADTHTATIHYGDGTITPAFAIAGGTIPLSHTYVDNGAYTVTVTVRDDDGGSQSDTLLVTVNNVAPTANADAYSVDEDGTLTGTAAGSVLANDTDPGAASDPLTAAVVTGTTNGTLTLNPNGSFTYAPNLNFNGSDSFTYLVSDGDGGSATGTVTITVNPVNDAPVASNDAYNTNEDTTLNVPAPGVLGNDTDVDSPTLTAVLVNGPSNGSLTPNADGRFSYSPNLNYNGPDSFTYKANDGELDSSIVTVNLTINPVNDAPVASNDAYGTNEDTTLNVPVPGVLGNDTDVDNPTLTAVLVTGPSNGSLTPNANGSFSYSPNLNYNGPDSFTYKANDGSADSNLATVSLTITSVNDAPTFDPIGNQIVNEDAALQTLSITHVSPGPSDEAAQTVTMTATSSDTSIVPDPTITGPGATRTLNYQPVTNANGLVTITVTANDGQSSNNTSTRTFAITVNPVNDVPSFTRGPDQLVAQNAGPQTYPAWATNISPGPPNESSQAVNFLVSNNNNSLFVTQPTVAPNGTLTYAPAPSATGVATVMVQIRDNGGTANGGVDTSAPQTFTITVYAFAGAGIGSFVIGDLNANIGQSVTFWGSQWAKSNNLSGGSSPSDFEGFATGTSSSPPNCGGSWSTDPGNSSNPPSTIPEYIGVFVTSSITKSGSKISGNIRQMVIIKTNPGYDDNPGHAGTGTVVAVICTSP
ncbi:MAG: tandem-95 repeat protein [Pyrinomonadaceae bacterium]